MNEEPLRDIRYDLRILSSVSEDDKKLLTGTPDKSEPGLFGRKKSSILDKITRDVFDEYDRAYLEGAIGKDTVALNRKHVRAVLDTGMLMVDALRKDGLQIPEWQENLIRVEILLHDAMKLVPERMGFNFQKEESSLRHRIVELQKKMQADGESEEIKAEITRLRGEVAVLRSEDIIGYEAEQKKHSGANPNTTRLLRHGEDSADFAEQLLSDYGFSSGLIDKVSKDIRAHMDMRYVNNVLNSVSESVQSSQRFEDPIEKTNALIAEMPEDVRLGKHAGKPMLHLPIPNGLEGSVLRAADFLSCGILADADIDNNPKAGSFDKLLDINFQIASSEMVSIPFEDAFNSAYGSVANNVHDLRYDRFSNKQKDTKEIELFLADAVGAEVLSKLDTFSSMVEAGTLVIKDEAGEVIDTVTGWDWFNVYDTYKFREGGNYDGTYDLTNIPKTMEKYYKAVKAFREVWGKDHDLNNIMNL